VSRLSISQARTADAQSLAPRLRKADLDEIAAASGEPPEVALHRGIVASADAQTVVCAGLPIAVFGVVNLGGGVGAPLLLGSDAILDNWFAFARRSREELARMRLGWAHLENYVDVRNTVHINWLSWLGAELDGPYTHGVARLPFWRFSLV
jgi:hypothetical protein